LHIIEDLPSVLPLTVPNSESNMVNNLHDGKYSQFYHPYFSAYYNNIDGYSLLPPPSSNSHLVSLPAPHSMNSSATRVAAPFIPPFPLGYYPGPGPPLQTGVMPEMRQMGLPVPPPLSSLPVSYSGRYTPMVYPLQMQMPLNINPAMTLPQIPASAIHSGYLGDPFAMAPLMNEHPMLPLPSFIPGVPGSGLVPYGYGSAPVLARPIVPTAAGSVLPNALSGAPAGVLPFSAAMNPTVYAAPPLYPDSSQLRLNPTIYGQFPISDCILNPAAVPAPLLPAPFMTSASFGNPQAAQFAPRPPPLSSLPSPVYYHNSSAASVTPNTDSVYSSASRQLNPNSSLSCDMNGNLLPLSSPSLSVKNQQDKRSRTTVDPSLLMNMSSSTSTSNYNSSSSSQK
jgi:hypothetical protein